MRMLVLALALSSTALATPALARDGSFYAGIEGGAMIVEDADIRVGNNVDRSARLHFNVGFDVDLVAGYDFGIVRLEGELGYKHAGLDQIGFFGAGQEGVPFDADGSGRAFSLMANALLDFGDEDGWSGSIGAGAGIADVRYRVDSISGLGGFDPVVVGFTNDTISDSRFAWQIVGGVRRAITPNLDLGVKYRFFRVGKIRDEWNNNVEARTKWVSHSLLLSLIYNFAAPLPPPPPPPPPAPPPPPPPTQVCPDGTVIPATEVCPAPPPPPPPPPPAPERG